MKFHQIQQHPYAFCVVVVGLFGVMVSFVQMLRPSDDNFLWGITFMVSVLLFGKSFLKFMFNPDSPRVKCLEKALREEWERKQRCKSRTQ